MTPQEIYIPVNSQELADELKEICIKYGLPIPRTFDGFKLVEDYKFFTYGKAHKYYAIFSWKVGKTQINKEQFIELLDNIKK